MSRIHGGALNTLNTRRGNVFTRRAGARRDRRGPAGRLLTDDQLAALTTLLRGRDAVPFTTDELVTMGMTLGDLAANLGAGTLTRAWVASKKTGKPVAVWAPTAFVREMRERPVEKLATA